jgi:hypothetical protein
MGGEDINPLPTDSAEKVGLNMPENETVAPVEAVDAKKVERYIKRGVEEVKSILSDLDFELGNILDEAGTTVKGVSFPEDGSIIMELQKSYTVTDPTKIGDVSAKAREFSIRNEFAKYVTYNVIPPGAASAEVQVVVKVKLPKEVAEAVVGGDVKSNWQKASKTVEKYAKTLLNSL